MDNRRERDVEAALTKWVKSQGGMCLKLTAPPIGIPDRLVLLPMGRVVFVELKRDKGKLSAVQHHVIQLLRSLGLKATVVYGMSGVTEFIKEHDNVQATTGQKV